MIWFRRAPSTADYAALVREVLDASQRASAQLVQLQDWIHTMFDELAAQVARNGDLINSASQLIQGLRAQITAAGTDPVALKAITDALASQDALLTSAVAANTPVAPVTTAPVVEPDPAPESTAPAPATDPAA